ncbi:MAG: methionyl-tRNA formyltransferase [Bacteroidetes bacterium]|nr:MAG: methionyl-tRNA formyltransferase [Bacteroidota bacterium]
MGTPDFAVASLKSIVESGFNVVAVITAPDRPAGRGQKLQESAVKTYAVEKGLPVLQPTNLKSPDFQTELASYKADIQVVIAFRMLPEAVWDMPRLGTFNLHASLLPAYRGAAPINRAIMNGEKETGVTTFFLKHEIDTGNIIFQEKIAISEDDTAGSLHDKLMNLGAELVVKTLNAVEAGDYPQEQQSNPEGTPTAPKIFKPDCKIDWAKSAVEVRNHIRGLSPYPAAWTSLGGKGLKVFQTSFVEFLDERQPGSIHTDGKHFLYVKCQDAYLSLEELQIEGKKRMGVEEFLRGYNGEVLINP